MTDEHMQVAYLLQMHENEVHADSHLSDNPKIEVCNPMMKD